MIISEEKFKEHERDDQENFDKINQRLDEQHEAVMAMLTPVYEAFDFKTKLTKKGMATIVRWTKIIALIIALISLGGVAWKIFLFAITQTKQ